jgi:type III pantothenate kinase
MSTRRLLLDAGNTRLKWVLVDDGVWREQGHTAYADLASLAQWVKPGTRCYIASVARARHEDQISKLLAPCGITPRWLVAEARFSDVRNSYAHPQQLGVDRWMGLIAARHRARKPALVVSAGTAMTVDALAADGTFMGGLIVPGVALMQQALQQGTARVAEVKGHWHAFPLSTPDAVESGILAALTGAVQLQHERMASMTGEMPHCILTGGDAEKLLPHLSMDVEHAPALVLEGIDCVAREDTAE